MWTKMSNNSFDILTPFQNPCILQKAVGVIITTPFVINAQNIMACMNIVNKYVKNDLILSNLVLFTKTWFDTLNVFKDILVRLNICCLVLIYLSHKHIFVRKLLLNMPFLPFVDVTTNIKTKIGIIISLCILPFTSLFEFMIDRSFSYLFYLISYFYEQYISTRCLYLQEVTVWLLTCDMTWPKWNCYKIYKNKTDGPCVRFAFPVFVFVLS